MRIGNLYQWSCKYHNYLSKYHGKLCLCVDIERLHSGDRTITNYKLLFVKTGKTTLVDVSCLKYLFPPEKKT